MPALWEAPAVNPLSLGYRMLVSHMQLHRVNQVLTPPVDFDCGRGFQRLDRDLFGMKQVVELD